jgi:hypothetical protein
MTTPDLAAAITAVLGGESYTDDAQRLRVIRRILDAAVAPAADLAALRRKYDCYSQYYPAATEADINALVEMLDRRDRAIDELERLRAERDAAAQRIRTIRRILDAAVAHETTDDNR